MRARSVAQSCLTFCDPVNHSPSGTSAHGILQTRILEWVAITSSRVSSQPRDLTSISRIGRQILYHWATWKIPVTHTHKHSKSLSTSPLDSGWAQDSQSPQHPACSDLWVSTVSSHTRQPSLWAPLQWPVSPTCVQVSLLTHKIPLPGKLHSLIGLVNATHPSVLRPKVLLPEKLSLISSIKEKSPFIGSHHSTMYIIQSTCHNRNWTLAYVIIWLMSSPSTTW